MEVFISSPQLAERFGRTARQMIEEKYSLEVARRRYVKELKSWKV
jgi:glycosyltransferase involved in cell wall biosynthesis